MCMLKVCGRLASLNMALCHPPIPKYPHKQVRRRIHTHMLGRRGERWQNAIGCQTSPLRAKSTKMVSVVTRLIPSPCTREGVFSSHIQKSRSPRQAHETNGPKTNLLNLTHMCYPDITPYLFYSMWLDVFFQICVFPLTLERATQAWW